MSETATYCEQCGETVGSTDRFCAGCGAPLQREEVQQAAEPCDRENTVPDQATKPDSDTGEQPLFYWTQRAPILGRNLVTKQLAIALFGSLAFAQVVLLIVGWLANGELLLLPWQAYVGITVFLLVLFLFVILVFFRNRYTLQIQVDRKGILYCSGTDERTLTRVTTIAGALAGDVRTAGAGLLAASNEAGGIPWQDIHRARIERARRRVVIYGPHLPHLELWCPAEAFEGFCTCLAEHQVEIEEE